MCNQHKKSVHENRLVHHFEEIFSKDKDDQIRNNFNRDFEPWGRRHEHECHQGQPGAYTS
jgi:hypothetical protein